MQTKISTKGQVVLPSPVRNRLGLQAGDSLDVQVEGDAILLRPRRAKRLKAKIIKDPISGYPVVSSVKNAPKLTNRQVRELLADFP
jgi:AbrB family looped-hinge helix DNA binding protein